MIRGKIIEWWSKPKHSSSDTPFTVSLDADERFGVITGISVFDRTATYLKSKD
jgi:hypothetical protein